MRNYDIEVLVRGRPVRVFEHEGEHFIEGRNGSKFELRITNNTHRQVEVVASVDGLSVINGEESGVKSEGYIIPANQNIVIPGWKLPDNKAAEFVFENTRDSYSSQLNKGTTNVGVIGVMIFEEHQPAFTTLYTPGIPVYPSNPWNNTNLPIGHNPPNIITSENISNIGNTLAGPNVRGIGDELLFTSTTAASASINCVDSSPSIETSDNFEIGTGWGDEISHNVTVVKFNRSNNSEPDEMISLFYDSRKALESRGIQVVRTKVKKVPKLPNAFPTYNNSGCKPPPGWKGKK